MGSGVCKTCGNVYSMMSVYNKGVQKVDWTNFNSDQYNNCSPFSFNVFHEALHLTFLLFDRHRTHGMVRPKVCHWEIQFRVWTYLRMDGNGWTRCLTFFRDRERKRNSILSTMCFQIGPNSKWYNYRPLWLSYHQDYIFNLVCGEQIYANTGINTYNFLIRLKWKKIRGKVLVFTMAPRKVKVII